jgi:hypothetical protein
MIHDKDFVASNSLSNTDQKAFEILRIFIPSKISEDKQKCFNFVGNVVKSQPHFSQLCVAKLEIFFFSTFKVVRMILVPATQSTT